MFHHENAGLFLVLYRHSFGEGSQDFFVAGKHIPPLAFLLLQEETCNVRECCELSGGTGGTAGESSLGDQRSPSQEAANIWAGRSSGPKQHVHHGSTVTLLASKKGCLSGGGTGASARLVPTVIYFPVLHKELRRTSLCVHTNTQRKAQHALAVRMLISLLKIKVNECQEDTDMQ